MRPRQADGHSKAPGFGRDRGNAPDHPKAGGPSSRDVAAGETRAYCTRAGGIALSAWLLGAALLAITVDCPARTGQVERESELEDLRREIAALNEHLRQARADESVVLRELRVTETSLGDVARELTNIGRRLRGARQRLGKLRRQERQLTAQLDAQRHVLAAQVRAAYMLGRQDYLKLLLNQEDPATLERTLAYYRYFSRARAEQIQRVEADLGRLETVRQNIRRKQSLQESLQTRVRKQKLIHEAQRQERARILAELRRDITRSGHELDGLKANAKELERLVESIRSAFQDIPTTLDKRISFQQKRGQLPWPSQGKLRHRFGTSRARGGLTWTGWVIDVREGEPVAAVHHGRVAFADWLRGFGLLVIVDHGEGFMTLYGHGRSLLKETGDWVEAGDTIATVGDSGGRTEPGLYFEIRHRGSPLNPSAWLSRG
ncbi:MAG: peptidoglycan DD-metalloendopeptidase family protein [Gammaproteobacteria bacterium]|nr:peptidoglycan DD-metalloendopeptidase family protein [Gammaproteobacteria bacterium]